MIQCLVHIQLEIFYDGLSKDLRNIGKFTWLLLRSTKSRNVVNHKRKSENGKR